MQDQYPERHQDAETNQDAAGDAFDDARGALRPDLDDAEEVSLEEAEALADDPGLADRSRPMDFHVRAEGQNLCAKLKALADQIANLRPRARFSPARAEQLERCVTVLALNLYSAWRADQESTVRLPRRAGWYAQPKFGKRRELPRGISHSYFVEDAFGGFVELGLVQEVKKGHWDKARKQGEVSRVRAAKALIALLEAGGRPPWPWEIVPGYAADGIVLKGPAVRSAGRAKRKPVLDFEETAETRRMRDNLARINAMLTRCWADLDLSDAEFERMAKERSERGRPIDLSRRTVRRVFNDGSFKRGGRFYGAWWQNVGKGYRRRITINGKNTVEVDFSGFHVAMLYRMEGMPLPEGDLYRLVPSHSARCREQAKKAFNALLNAGPKGIRRFKDFDEAEAGMAWTEFLQAVREKHELVAKHLGTGIGIELQHRDSRIAERVMLRFAEMDAACLPVHDSFLVHQGHEDDLKEIMVEEYERETGGAIEVKAMPFVRNPDQYGEEDEFGVARVPDDLDWLLDQSDHEERLGAWFSHRSRRRAGHPVSQQKRLSPE